MKTYVELEVQAHTFLTSALDGQEQSASGDYFTSREETPLCSREVAEWAPEPAWTPRRRERSVLARDQTWIPQPFSPQPIATLTSNSSNYSRCGDELLSALMKPLQFFEIM
jgi:hypothetical protein